MVSALSESSRSDGIFDWLLEPSNPSVRYLALTRILRRPEGDPQVVASRECIPQADPARAILSAQYPQGYWMRPGIGHSPRYRATLWQILFLAQLGVGRNQAVDRAVEHLFAYNQREDGAFRAGKAQDGTPTGLHASLLWALEMLGCGSRREVGRAWSWLAQRVEKQGFRDASGGMGPLYGAVKVLGAVNAVPGDRREGVVEKLRAAAVAALLARPPDAVRGNPLLDQLTFPLAEGVDVLQWLAVLVEAGCGADPALEWARSWVTRKKLRDGRWPLERVPGKLWAGFGEIGCPNKWVTIRALQAGC